MKSLPRLLLLAGFALLIFGSKLWLIDYAGTDLPTMDQWDGEGEWVLRPWLEHRLDLHAFIEPHNEHRLITTKLFTLGLLMANGQWDNLVEAVASAGIHTLCAIVLLLAARRWLAGAWLTLFGGLLVLLFALPFAWENTLTGFQVQFYFLLLFSLGHLLLTLDSDRFSWRWALGQVCGLLALGSLATGFFSAASIVLVLGWRRLQGQKWTTQNFVTAGIAFGCILLGWRMRVEVPGHAVLHAHGMGEFARSFLQLLAWPGPFFLPLACAPAALVVFRALRRNPDRLPDRVLLGLVFWILLQCAALAYGRGASRTLASRYFDLLSVNLALGFIIVVRSFSGQSRRWIAALSTLGLAVGLFRQSVVEFREDIRPLIGVHHEEEAVVRDYLRTSNPDILTHNPWPRIPYPSGVVLRQRLDTSLQQVLPPSVRRPIGLKTGENATAWTVPAALLPTTFSIAFSTQNKKRETPVEWRSTNQPGSTGPILRFRVAGDLGAPGRALHLTVKSPEGEVDVIPDSAPGDRWKNVSIRRPAGEWWVEASDHDSKGWFAFTEPVELTRGTWFAEKLLKSFPLVLAMAGVLIAGGVLIRRLNSPDPEQAH